MTDKTNITPPMIIYPLLLVIFLLHITFPVIQILHFPFTLSGILILIVGLVINTKGSLLLSRSKSTFIPQEAPSMLIINGPFRFSRNPIYLGGVIIILGISVLMGSIIAFLAPIITFLIVEFYFIPIEEKKLEESFGNKYLEYKNQVRRWI
jgi:protein-S-isoprenylcysteine O-methyltransferase Ste14